MLFRSVISNQGHMLLSKGAYPIISHSTTMLVSEEATLVDPNGVSLPLMDSLPAPFNATHPHCSSCVPKPSACIHESLGLVALFAFPFTCALMAMQSFEHVLSNIDDTINYFHPFSMLAPTTTPSTNTYMLSHALQEPDAPDFLHASQAEIAAHETNRHWLKVPCSTMPASHKPIPAVWAMKCKT